MTRKFILWAGTYFAGLAFIWWLGSALLHQWLSAEAVVIAASVLLWTNLAFRYAYLMGVAAREASHSKNAPR